MNNYKEKVEARIDNIYIHVSVEKRKKKCLLKKKIAIDKKKEEKITR